MRIFTYDGWLEQTQFLRFYDDRLEHFVDVPMKTFDHDQDYWLNAMRKALDK